MGTRNFTIKSNNKKLLLQWGSCDSLLETFEILKDLSKCNDKTYQFFKDFSGKEIKRKFVINMFYRFGDQEIDINEFCNEINRDDFLKRCFSNY